MTTRRRRDLSRRLRAVLACGLVLGVGASTTLAAWNDSEYTKTTFTAGTFTIVGATNGSTFTEHATAATAATLTFTTSSIAAAMTPGDKVYGLYSVKTGSSSMAGTVQLKAASTNGTGLGAYLTYSVRTITQTTCNATNFTAGSATTGLPSGVALTVGATTTQSLSAKGADQINYCFEITLPTGTANAAQGTTLDASWEFTASSSS